MHVDARDCKDWGFGIGFALNEARNRCAYDAKVYDGVYFLARSGRDRVSARFTVGMRQTQPLEYGGDGTCGAEPNAGCWDAHAIDFNLTPEWRFYAYRWKDLKQGGWGKPVRFDVTQITSLIWSSGSSPKTFREIWVDQIGFFKNAPPKSPFPP